MNKEEFVKVADKISSGTASREEIEAFNRYYNTYQEQFNNWDELTDIEKDAIGKLVKGRIDHQIQVGLGVKKAKLWPKMVAAASVLLVLSFCIYNYWPHTSSSPEVAKNVDQDIHAGGNKAFLTLADGRKISLDGSKKIDIDDQSGVRITKTDDGQLIYQVTNTSNTEININSIETPKGGQYQVRLPDGTMVWLNSSSVMRYPVRFSGQKRTVEIEGEAYFEVAHNPKMPFVVQSAKQQVEVLGTHFNVMAYHDEAEVQTTLIRGAVKVNTAQNSLLLQPGQQAQVSNSKVILNPDVDVDRAIAWKTGKIQFFDMDIQSIMRMLSRWYDFKVEYRGKPINTTFGGSFSRTKNLSIILKALESTGDVHFKIEGRRVIVMP